MPFIRPIPESQPVRKASPAVDAWVQAEKLMQIAILLPAAALIGWLAGAWLDNRLHQEWIAIFGVVLAAYFLKYHDLIAMVVAHATFNVIVFWTTLPRVTP